MSRTDNRDIFKVTNGVGVERVSDTPNTPDTSRMLKTNSDSSRWHERCEC
jgi:hypothetical protein